MPMNPTKLKPIVIADAEARTVAMPPELAVVQHGHQRGRVHDSHDFNRLEFDRIQHRY